SGSGSALYGVPEPFLRQVNLNFQAGAEVQLDAMFSIWGFHAGLNKTASATFNAGCTWTPSTGVTLATCKTGNSSSGSARQPYNRADAQSPSMIGKGSDLKVSMIQPAYDRFGDYAVFNPEKPLLKNNAIHRSSKVP